MGWSLYIYGRENDKRILLAELGRSSNGYQFLDDDDSIMNGAFNIYKKVDTDDFLRVLEKFEKNILLYRLDTPYPLTNQNREQSEWFECYNELVETYGYLLSIYHRCYNFIWHGIEIRQVSGEEERNGGSTVFGLDSGRYLEFYIG
jgi:hypothetical protein